MNMSLLYHYIKSSNFTSICTKKKKGASLLGRPFICQYVSTKILRIFSNLYTCVFIIKKEFFFTWHAKVHD